jgi:hypothetical protein
MSAHFPLTVPRVSAQAARKHDGLSMFARALAAVEGSASAVRKALFARRSRVSNTVFRLKHAWSRTDGGRIRDAACLGDWKPSAKGCRFVMGQVRGRSQDANA